MVNNTAKGKAVKREVTSILEHNGNRKIAE